MKTVHFAKDWVYRPSDTVREEYAAGSEPRISNDRASAAAAAGVLKGEPVDAGNDDPETTEG